MRDGPVNSRLWLRDELDAEALRLLIATPAEEHLVRHVPLSELEALAVLILALDTQAQAGADSDTREIAHRVSSALLTRLDPLA